MTPEVRRTTFRIVTVIFGAGLGLAGFGFLSLVGGWVGAGGREEHRVHDLAYGAVAGLLIALPMLLQAVAPERKPALMQGIAAAGLGFGAGYALGDAPLFVLAPVVVVAILWWLHPARDQLASFGRPHPALLGLAVLAAIPLVVFALDQGELQRACAAGDQHCDEFHFAGMASLAFALPLVGVVASFRNPGWRILAWLAGAAAGVLGLSSLMFPDLLSSLGTTWGAVALGGGIIFVAAAELVRRSAEPRASRA